MFVDSHCHINFETFTAQMPALLDRMQQRQVSHALCVSVDLETFPQVLDVATAHANVFASVGVHPDHEDVEEPDVERLLALSAHPKIVAIGETGLDYFRLEDRTVADMEWQRQRFRTHIRAARASGKPLIVHTRASAEDTLRLMREERADEIGGVLHCFTETWEVAQAALDMNFYISLSGIVTFKNAVALQDVARRVPEDRLLIETDSPYLAPVPYRGKTNEPSYVADVGHFVAQLRGQTPEALGAMTTANFFRLFSHAAQ
ncbi:TatD family hydrolase [Robbsia sp. KACC 23696]|uniref:TatD family hydrolase n=1 Tax=Robbsia sp. KACC 23696 TaxID=3149231 RepID=UPI00325A8428